MVCCSVLSAWIWLVRRVTTYQHRFQKKHLLMITTRCSKLLGPEFKVRYADKSLPFRNSERHMKTQTCFESCKTLFFPVCWALEPISHQPQNGVLHPKSSPLHQILCPGTTNAWKMTPKKRKIKVRNRHRVSCKAVNFYFILWAPLFFRTMSLFDGLAR